MVAPLAVVAPGPILIGLFAGPGIAVHVLAKRIFAHIEKEPAQLLSLSAFSAVVSSAIAFALIESTLVVAAVSLVTFAVIIAYELAHPKAEVINTSLNKDIVAKAIEQAIADQVVPKLTALETAIGQIEVEEGLTEAQLQAALKALPKGVTQTEVQAAIRSIPKGVTKAELTAALTALPKGATLKEIEKRLQALPKQGPDTELRAQVQALQETIDALKLQIAQHSQALVQPDALAEPRSSGDAVLERLEGVKSAGQQIFAGQQNIQEQLNHLETYLNGVLTDDDRRETALQEAVDKVNKVDMEARFQVLHNQVTQVVTSLARFEGVLMSLNARQAPMERGLSTADLSVLSMLQQPQQGLYRDDMRGHLTRPQSCHDFGVPRESESLRTSQGMQSRQQVRPKSASPLPLRSEDLDTTLTADPSQTGLRGNGEPVMHSSPAPSSPEVVADKSLIASGGSAFTSLNLSSVLPERGPSPEPQPPVSTHLVSREPLDSRELKLARERFQDMHPKDELKPRDFKRQAAMKDRLALAFYTNPFNSFQAEVIAEAIREGRVKVDAPVVQVPGSQLGTGSSAYRTLLQDHTLESGNYVVESWFICAARGNEPRLMDYLATQGAKTDTVTTSPALKGHQGRLAANFAARFGSCDALKWLVDHGGLATFGGLGGKVPLLFDAACSSSTDALELVLKQSGVDAKSANTVVSSLLHDDASQVWRCENTSCNAFHVALLRKDQIAAEMLMKSGAIDVNVKTEATKPQSYGAQMSPLHLLLHFINEDNLGPEHWMVELATQIMRKMSRKQCLEEGNTWYKDRATTARPLPVKFTEVVKRLQKETAEKLKGALPKA